MKSIDFAMRAGIVIAALQLLLAAAVLWRHGAPGAFGGDFIAYYAAGEQLLAQGPDQLYVLAQQQRFQQPLLAASGLSDTRPAVIPFNYPAPAALLFLPFALLPARIGVALWIALNLLLVVASGMLGIGQASPYGRPVSGAKKRAARILLPLLFFPVDWGLLAGQPVGLVLLLGTLVFIGLTRNRPGLAGISLGLLAALKPQLVIGPAIGLLVLGRRRAIAAFALVVSAMLALTVALGGVSGIQAYLALLKQMDPAQGNAALAVQASAMVNWRALLVRVPGLDEHGVLLATFALGALTLLLAGLRCRRWAAQPERVYAVMTAAGILASYHSHYQDLVMLVPPALAAFPAVFAHRVRSDAPRLYGARRAAMPSGRSSASMVRRLAAPVAVLLLAVVPGVVWLSVGLFALGLLHVWTVLAVPSLALVLIGAGRENEVIVEPVEPVDNAKPVAASPEGASAICEPAALALANGAS